MTKFAIETGAPPPARCGAPRGGLRDTVRRLEPGQFVRAVNTKPTTAQSTVRMVRMEADHRDKKFVTRTENGVCVIYRTA